MLFHRIPYPPNKGDKIRSWHLLRVLSDKYSIFLGCFIDDLHDLRYQHVLEDICEECCFIRVHSGITKVKSLTKLLSNKSLSEGFYASRKMQQWVQSVAIRNGVDKVVMYCSVMAQYVFYENAPFSVRLIDFVDVDSDKWRQYAVNKSWPANWIYRRESERLLSFERKVASCADGNFFVSSTEAEFFKKLAPESEKKIHFYNNGVDLSYFDPSRKSENPYFEGEKALVFTGAMDYWPNVDAVRWFATNIFPRIRQEFRELSFYIVGSNPGDAVHRLASIDGVTVTGRVEDIRPYIQHAVAAVAPLRIARGVQNKVLEAMALSVPVLVSRQGLEGIPAEHGTHILVSETLDDYRSNIRQILQADCDQLKRNARALILDKFQWERNIQGILSLL